MAGGGRGLPFGMFAGVSLGNWVCWKGGGELLAVSNENVRLGLRLKRSGR